MYVAFPFYSNMEIKPIWQKTKTGIIIVLLFIALPLAQKRRNQTAEELYCG